MGVIAKDYFKTIFATSHSSNVDKVLGVVDGVVTEKMNRSLNRPFVGEEVKQELFQMHSSKSPGPPYFFRNTGT